MEKSIIGILALIMLLCIAGVIIYLLQKNAKLRKLINRQKVELRELRKKQKAQERSMQSSKEGISIH